MGVGLYLQGRYRASAKKSKDPAGAWLERVADWLDNDVGGDKFWGNFFKQCQLGTTHDDEPALFVAIHPAGEEVEFIVPEPGRVIVSAKTSTVGPGYHTALCKLLRWFGKDLKVSWNPAGEDDDSSQDETGYFFTGD